MVRPSKLRATRAFLRALVHRESLALAPVPPPRPPRGRVLRALFAPEPLPRDPPAPPRRRGRWLAWLFAIEPLDPP